MAQYDLLMLQNVAAAGVEYSEKSVTFAKGCLISSDTNHVPTILAVGTNAQVLVADSGETTGLKWVDRLAVAFATCTVTLDWANGQNQHIQLANGGQTFTFANPADGGKYVLVLKQPASGAAGTVTWPATVVWGNKAAPVLTTTNKYVDVITFLYDSAESKYYGFYDLGFVSAV